MYQRRAVALRKNLPRGQRDEALSGGDTVTNEKPANVAASVRQQLLVLSRERGEDFQLVLTWYAAERFLY